MALPVDRLLHNGAYSIVRFISSGGFGCTYEAQHMMLGKRVAIKELFVKNLCTRDPDTGRVSLISEDYEYLLEKVTKKFIDEAKTIAKLSHPGIVNVSDVFEDNGTAYYVMEYIEGRSIGDIIDQEGPMDESRAIGYMRQACDALNYVHSRNVLHLDIKPGNIMVDSNNRVLLIDFGVSKQYDLVQGENKSTLMGKTPGFAPIEQMDNDVTKFLPATDIYALGATLYKMLTGKTPPTATQLASGESLPLLPDHVSPQVQQAIVEAMQLNKMERPQTVKEFMAIIDGAGPQEDDNLSVVSIGTGASEPTEAKVDDGAVTRGVEAESKGKDHGHWKVMAAVFMVSAVLSFGVSYLLRPGGDADVSASDDIAGDSIESVIDESAVEIVTSTEDQGRPRREQPVVVPVEMDEAEEAAAPVPETAVVNRVENGSIRTYTINGVPFSMCRVDGGDFYMGAHDNQANDAFADEKPLHRVSVGDFWIGETEVTQELWQAVMEYNPSRFGGEGWQSLPVESVSWNDCILFVTTLNEITGENFRLPTEAQWEFAARGGNSSKGYAFSGSDNLSDVSWHTGNSQGRTHAVGSKGANELGLYDMTGNVSEWCGDWYGEVYYGESPQSNPAGPKEGKKKIARGGGWKSSAKGSRTSLRPAAAPGAKSEYIGLRLAM